LNASGCSERFRGFERVRAVARPCVKLVGSAATKVADSLTFDLARVTASKPNAQAAANKTSKLGQKILLCFFDIGSLLGTNTQTTCAHASSIKPNRRVGNNHTKIPARK
jgi:hypothetical protein